MQRVVSLLLSVLVVVVAACGSERSCPPATAGAAAETRNLELTPASRVRSPDERKPTAPSPDVSDVEPLSGPCPLNVPGAAVSVAGLDDGAALVFTTADDPVELRRKVGQLRSKLGAQDALGARRSRLDNVERGIRIVFVASTPADVGRLRQELTRYAGRLAKSCALTLGEAESADRETETEPQPQPQPQSLPPGTPSRPRATEAEPTADAGTAADAGVKPDTKPDAAAEPVDASTAPDQDEPAVILD